MVSVWVDGSCLGNGTLSASGAIGVYYGARDSRNFSSKLCSVKQTNNKSELLAILYVLCTTETSDHLTIHSDSLYSILCLTSYHHKWRSNNWVTSKGDLVESADIVKYSLALIEKRELKGGTTQLVHVRGHSQDHGNNAADALANSAARHVSEQPRLRLLRRFGAPF